MVSFLVLLLEMIVLHTLPIPKLSDVFILLLICIFSFIFMLDIFSSKRHKEVAGAIFTAYGFRLFLLFFDLYGRKIYSLPNSGADTEWFYSTGQKVAAGVVESSDALIRLTSLGIKFLGDSRLYLQFLLMLFSIITITTIDRILEEFKLDIKQRKLTVYIIGLLPNFAILSSIYLRESLVTMLISNSFYFWVKWIKRKNELNFYMAIVLVLGASVFHSGAIGVAVGYIVVKLVYNRKKKKIRFSISTIVMSLVFLIGFMYLYNNYAEVFFGKMLNVENLEDVANLSKEGGSSYAAYVGNSNSLRNMIVYTPIRMIMFQFSPFIWQVRGLNDIIAMIFDSFFFLYVIYKSFSYIRNRKTENKTTVILVLIIVFAVTFVFGWGVTNTGTALRHRNKLIVLYAVLFGITSCKKDVKRG